MTLSANAARTLRSRTLARLSVYDTIIELLLHHLEDMAAELGQFIQEEHAMVGQRHFTRHRHVAPADQPRIRDGMVRRATVRVVTNAVRLPLSPPTLSIRVVSMASARVIAGRMVVKSPAVPASTCPPLGNPGKC